jgi:two-component system NarL family sensor kinase
MLALASPGLAACLVLLAHSSLQGVQFPLMLILAVCALVGSRISFDIEGTLFWDGSFLPMICSAALLGPVPTAGITLLSEAAVWQRERYSPKVVPLNLVGTLAPNLLASWVLTSGGSSLEGVSFYALLATAVCGSIAVNAMLITALAGVLYDAPILARLSRHRTILAPIAVNVVLALGAIAAYRGEGLLGTGLVISGVFVFAYVANRLRADRQQRAEIESLATSRGRLVAELLTVEDRERRAVADAIHDELIQTLLAIRQDLREPAGPGPHAGAHLDIAVARARQIIRATHPTVLDRVGLVGAIRAIAEEAAGRAGLAVTVNVDPRASEVDDRLVFGAVRELLNNVVKHAHASEASIWVSRAPGVLRMVVADDGIGVQREPDATLVAQGHIGLSSLTDRVDALGGELCTVSTEAGTRVTVTLPIPAHGPEGPYGGTYRASANTSSAALGGPQGPMRAQ